MNESQKIYVVYPGYVRSRNDIQWHFLSVRKLMAFYKVDSKLYVIQKKRDHVDSLGLIVLRPRNDGDYLLPSSRGM